MRKFDLKNIVWKEGKHYVAWNLNSGVSSFGSSRKEALEALHEAMELYFEDSLITSIQKVERPDIVPMTLKYA
jgi:predicted RNase H-like HicB family nuclease